MRLNDLPPEAQAEARRLLEHLTAACAVDLEGLACLVATKDDAHLLGVTEFEVRDRVQRLGAKALEAALDGRKKRATTAPPGPAPTAGRRPAASAGRAKRS